MILAVHDLGLLCVADISLNVSRKSCKSGLAIAAHKEYYLHWNTGPGAVRSIDSYGPISTTSKKYGGSGLMIFSP